MFESLLLVILIGSGLLIISVLGLFLAAGGWMLGMGLRQVYPEAHVWTFDRAARSFTIARHLRHRVTRALHVETTATYPLPAPGSVRVRRTRDVEHAYQELEVSVAGRTVRGMRRRLMFGNLTLVAREINDFLAG